MPTPALPPLIWLRAFDAAGRLGSFAAAARDLHVSPSAISHQIKALEAHLDLRLFERSAGGLRLSPAGQRYWEQVSAAFEQLRAASQELRHRADAQRIRISASPFFTSEWLLPLLPAFEAAFPGQILHLSATEALEDPAAGDTDFAVRFGQGYWPDVECLPLADLQACPVVAAGLDAARLPRLDYGFHGGTAWSHWQGRGLPLPGRDGEGPVVSHFDAAMRATERGLGVSLAVLPLVRPWLQAGRLERVAGYPAIPIGQLSLLGRHWVPSQARMRAVRDWLQQTLRERLAP
ncbi:MAG TPA: LysR family transcriptional regulator [Nevskiaceae bacterium]|nr:LysR family transcriptional regulator [Nevskiaceae bacterium]